MTIRIKVFLENETDMDDLRHYAECAYHGPELLNMLTEAAEAAKQKMDGVFPIGIMLSAGDFHPGQETEYEMDGLTTEEVTESDVPFAPNRQSVNAA